MAQNYSLALYSITIHKHLDKRSKFVLTDFCNGCDLYTIALEMLSSIKYDKESETDKKKLAQKNDETEKKFFRIMKGEEGDIIESRRPYLTGIIESGEYGTEENIVNVETGETKKKNQKDALLRPFYFMLYVPKGGKMAILLLERISNLGILTVFEKKLQEAVSKKVGSDAREYVITITPFAMETVLKKHMSILGGAKKVILNRVNFNNISASKISDGELNDHEIGSTEVTFNAPRNGNINILPWLDKIQNRFNTGKKRYSNIIAIDGIEFGDVKFAVEIGGSLRTISMQDIGKLGTYLDITNQIVMDKNKYPTYSSVNNQAHVLITDIKKQIENGREV